jgi:LacI family transcriptional regulator
VGADQTRSGAISLVVDDAQAGRVAAEHLLSKGLRSFAAYGIHGRDDPNPFAATRAAAFRQTVEQAGGRFTGWSGVPARTLPRHGSEWTRQCREWLAAIPKPAGVLACCDSWAEWLLAECRVLGVQVPEQVSVVSVDNQEVMCLMTSPALSSVIIPWERIGQELAGLVEKVLRGEPRPTRPLLIPVGDVFVRRSSEFQAVDDPRVAQALRFIAAHGSRSIGVPAVVSHLNMNRRELERRFRRVLGRTIAHEIRHVHVAEAKRLLAATELPLETLARRCGFTGAKKLCETFQRELGVTPGSYRQQHRLR